jgi:hypothetical protein
VEESLLLPKCSEGKGPAHKEGGSFRRRLRVEMGVWEVGDNCKEGGSFRVRRKDRLYSRTKTTWFGFNQNYITIKIKKIKNIYRSYRLTDNKLLTNRLPTDKLIGINFLSDY